MHALPNQVPGLVRLYRPGGKLPHRVGHYLPAPDYVRVLRGAGTAHPLQPQARA